MGKITLYRDDFYFVKIFLPKKGQPNNSYGDKGMRGEWVLGNLYKASLVLQHVLLFPQSMLSSWSMVGNIRYLKPNTSKVLSIL